MTDSGRGDTDTPDGEVYTDSTGTDLTQFIINTLNKNTKDRVLMLKLEQEMSSLARDATKTHQKFPPCPPTTVGWSTGVANLFIVPRQR